MARSWDVGAIAQELQQFPAAHGMDRATQFGAHPACDFRASPQAAIRSRAIQGVLQFSTLSGRHECSFAWIGVTSIADGTSTLLVVAADNRIDPGAGVARDG